VDTMGYIKHKYKNFIVVPREYVDAEVGVTVSSLIREEYIGLDAFADMVDRLLGGEDICKVMGIPQVAVKKPKYLWRWSDVEAHSAKELAAIVGIPVTSLYSFRSEGTPMNGHMIEKIAL